MSGLEKYGAVRCSHCDSCDVSTQKEGHVKTAEGVDNKNEVFVCRSCGREFSKII